MAGASERAGFIEAPVTGPPTIASRPTVPPTAIAAALACYVVGGGTVGQVFRRAWPPMAVLAALALLMLVFAKQLAGVLT